jgi:primase-polymerase (primpol)-like protein
MTTGEIYGSSFYVGDAAGRKGDHSAADIGFAKVRYMFYNQGTVNVVNLKLGECCLEGSAW